MRSNIIKLLSVFRSDPQNLSLLALSDMVYFQRERLSEKEFGNERFNKRKSKSNKGKV